MWTKMPKPTDEAHKTRWKKNDTKARKLLIDSRKDHLVPILSKMKSTRIVFKSLQDLYEINNTSRALALK